MIAYQSDEGRIGSLVEGHLAGIRQLDMEVYGTPESELGKINALSKGESIALRDDMLTLITKAKDLAAQTKGWFDITAPKNGENKAPDYRKVAVDAENKTLTFKSDDMSIDISNIWPAYLADKLLGALVNDGLTDVKVEVGAVSRNVGHDIHTPWKISLDLPNPESNYAYRSYVYSFSNKAAAQLVKNKMMAPIIDPKTREPINNNFQSVLVFGNDSVTASALALALYAMGPKDAQEFTEKHPEIKSIMVDSEGKFINSKSFHIGRPQYEENATTPAINGGENGLNQTQ